MALAWKTIVLRRVSGRERARDQQLKRRPPRAHPAGELDSESEVAMRATAETEDEIWAHLQMDSCAIIRFAL